MNRNRTIATLVGVCFILSNLTFMLGAVAFVEPVLGAPDLLSAVNANQGKLVTGALLELINGVFYLCIAALLFPILQKRADALAIGYVAFRVIEFTMQILAELSPMALLTVSEGAVQVGSAASGSFEAVTALLLANRLWAFRMISVFLAAGAFILYPVMYRTRLVPRFISIWGLIGAAGVLITALLEMFGLSPGSFGILMLLNELFLGGWLIAKGFSEPLEQ